MKLLGWMHRKFRQNSHEPFKEFSIGNCYACLTGQSPLDDTQYHPKLNCCNKHLIRGQRDNQLRKSFASSDPDDFEEEEEEETSGALSELFHGFLAIGTLGTDPVINNDPSSTPTFSISVENIMEKETEVTENELKLINDELEKVLGADESCNLSSGRNSHVSTGRNSHVSVGRSSHCSTGRNSHVSAGRISHCSTITLGGKLIESSTENNVCPLQSYLLGSAIGLPETTPPAAKKEHRVSLGELFQKSKQTEENYGSKPEKRVEKDTDKLGAFLVKKLLKRKLLHASNKNSMAFSGGTSDSASAETKLHKILHIFHRKVHPESSSTAEKYTHTKPNQVQIKTDARPYIIEAPEYTDEDIIITPYQALSKERMRQLKGQPNQSHLSLDDDKYGEHWIKTDSDYLVLEL
ncbi:OLC1v1028627C2 [Oldenlandia corymbosa var. corymbosa]|uniref:OLC1v1028627C2 n=1 Tax=Oldenlandia corymbosa var. corymbosa TaxID=529605 RepID=A0AAV1CES7_OLDCO|nr:OLC1v1028627C2 [Oldenlandia corymbosa var. corymbosa]